MNILYLNTTHICGGAEKVTNQIMDGMKQKGHTVYEIVCYHKRSEPLPSHIYVLYHSIPMLAFKRVITGNHSNANLTIPYSKHVILKFIKEKHIDVVHLHNAHGNFLGIRDIQAIADICPLIWTIHDFWPLTGHCTSPTNCPDYWKTGCTCCPQLNNYPPIRKDIAHKLWKEKCHAFSHPNIHYVVPSHWMLEQTQNSHLRNASLSFIPNSLNPSDWYNYNKSELRKKYQIPDNKRILSFVAADPTKKTKGMHLLLEALHKLTNPEKYFLLIAGQESNLEQLKQAGFSYRHFGYLSEQKEMNEFYALADILVNPSIYETFGLVNIEAMASGTPVIAFSVCAMEEIITPECGWCIKTGNIPLLTQTIQMAFESDLSQMGQSARKQVESNFSELQMLHEYENLYKKVVTS